MALGGTWVAHMEVVDTRTEVVRADTAQRVGMPDCWMDRQLEVQPG